MKQMQGKQSILFQNPVKILSHACVGGKKEGEGPIGKHLDLIVYIMTDDNGKIYDYGNGMNAGLNRHHSSILQNNSSDEPPH